MEENILEIVMSGGWVVHIISPLGKIEDREDKGDSSPKGLCKCGKEN